MKACASYGHLRIAELAKAVWPDARYAEQLARRTVARLVAQGLLSTRRNALGSTSLCVTRVGASWLEVRGVPARHTLDLSSVSGATFFHRTLASRYLIEREVKGAQVAGEYVILRKAQPFSLDPVLRTLRKLPDGLVWQRRGDGVSLVEFVEQEAAPKARAEIERCLKVAELVGVPLPGDGRYMVGGLTFVFDRSLNHARRIVAAADALWGSRSPAERAALERRVKLVAVELRDPLVWVGADVMTLNDLRRRS